MLGKLGGLFCTALLALIAGFAEPVAAAETSVAVAANFTEPAKAIAAAFTKATGNTATLSFGASGLFYTQMTHGAPFEVFLSADTERPARMEEDGLAVAGSRFTYATGRLVLYSATPGLVDPDGKVLNTSSFAHIAIAEPSAAPYGAAAVATMTRLGVFARLQPRLVTGSSITQTYQFVATGAAELGFVAQSQVIDVTGGSRWLVPATLHPPIEQGAVLLKVGAANPVAMAFLKFMRGSAARAIIRRYGYDVP